MFWFNIHLLSKYSIAIRVVEPPNLLIFDLLVLIIQYTRFDLKGFPQLYQDNIHFTSLHLHSSCSQLSVQVGSVDLKWRVVVNQTRS